MDKPFEPGEQERIVAYLHSLDAGYTDEEIENITDPRMLRLLRQAVRGDAMLREAFLD